MSRAPVTVLGQLRELMERHDLTIRTPLGSGLGLDLDGRCALADRIGEAWQVPVSYRAAENWRTVGDICAWISGAMELEAA